jgi:hypothetical protein
MKVSVEIECTPIEARSFFGLPDMTAFNESMTRQLEERIKASTAMIDPQQIMQTWFNLGGVAQENFFRMMSGAMPTTPSAKR